MPLWAVPILFATVSIICIVIRYFQLRKPKDPIMATIQEISAATDRLRAAVDRAVPILVDAQNRIDPATLDPVRDNLNAAADSLIAALPPQ